jgi:hypothetical protein
MLWEMVKRKSRGFLLVLSSSCPDHRQLLIYAYWRGVSVPAQVAIAAVS